MLPTCHDCTADAVPPERSLHKQIHPHLTRIVARFGSCSILPYLFSFFFDFVRQFDKLSTPHGTSSSVQFGSVQFSSVHFAFWVRFSHKGKGKINAQGSRKF